MRRWWDSGAAKVAHCIPTGHGDLLVTHAGLSCGWWSRIGEPTSAAETADALNDRLGDDPHHAFGRGWVLDRGTPSRCAGPVWNDTSAEGWGCWADRGDVPFSQVHGHAAPWSWRRERWLPGTTRQLRRTVELDHHRRRAHLSLPGGTLTSVDTGPHAGVGVPGDPVLEVQVRSRCQVLQAA